MFYEYLRDIDPHQRFIYIIGIICSILFFRRLALSTHIIVGFVVGICVILYFNEKDRVTNSNFLIKMKSILAQPCLKPHLYKDLYRDSELVIFLDYYKEYYFYNPDAYNTIVRHINDFLIMSTDVNVSDNYHSDYEILRELKLSILNIFHSFVYRIPHAAATNDKYQKGLIRLEKLLNYHIDKAHRVVVNRDQKSGISINSRFPHRNHPKHYDARWHDRFEYFQ